MRTTAIDFALLAKEHCISAIVLSRISLRVMSSSDGLSNQNTHHKFARDSRIKLRQRRAFCA